jgi:hypothetical protein
MLYQPMHSQARDTIAVEYYLNGPDAETRAAERAATSARSAASTQVLRDMQRSHRGRMLV